MIGGVVPGSGKRIFPIVVWSIKQWKEPKISLQITNNKAVLSLDNKAVPGRPGEILIYDVQRKNFRAIPDANWRPEDVDTFQKLETFIKKLSESLPLRNFFFAPWKTSEGVNRQLRLSSFKIFLPNDAAPTASKNRV